MVNQLGKFTADITELSQPLRELLIKNRTRTWGPSQEKSFKTIKEVLTKPHVLALYNPTAPTKVSADASAYGLGAVLLQQNSEKQWRPVAYASRSLTETETRYAQIEKEALATTWACERFSNYILGKSIEVETDHKPLVPLLSTKHLDAVPPRVLRFRLQLMGFDFTIRHVPGNELYTADALSRAPQKYSQTDEHHAQFTEQRVSAISDHLPTSPESLEQYRREQQEDPLLQRVSQYCQNGWPEPATLKGDIKHYWHTRQDMTTVDNILLYQSRIVVPDQLRETTMQKIHQGHQGIERCRLRLTAAVWWPGSSKDMEAFVKRCPTCMKNSPPVTEPMMPSQLPSHPWERLATDLFELKGKKYIIVVDYFSRYPEVIQLSSTTSSGIITAMKTIFSRHGIPRTLVSDNGPQFTSSEMKQFASAYGFQQVTTSPYHPQSNGLVERMVQTVKKLISNTDDPCLTLLSYRATPLPWCNLSPAELLMGRRVRTDIPQSAKLLTPNWPHLL